jgi:signal transduction histidine kinase
VAEKLLARRNEELETIDRIVEILNSEVDLSSLMHAVLEQGMTLLPQAEKAVVFMYNPVKDAFVLADAIGYDFDRLAELNFTNEELYERYVASSSEVEPGIFLLRHDGELRGDDKLTALPQARSMLIMAVHFAMSRKDNDGYLVFDNLRDVEAFTAADARRVKRYREHAITALAKARSMQAMVEKNEELLRTQEQLVVQQKLASLGQLTAGIAHEIRNPLNFMTNFALNANELVEEIRVGIGTGEPVEELLSELSLAASKIREHGNRANRIVEGMLMHARSQAGERQETPVNRLVQDAMHLAYHGMRANRPDFQVSLFSDFDPDVGSLNIVTADISRVVLSILDNAFYAVWKKAQSSDASAGYVPEVHTSTLRLPSQVEIRIRDNGLGISQDVLQHVFDPFFTTKPTGEGTGLGLSLSHDIVAKQHGGSMRADSVEGQWAEITIVLPAP